MKKYILGKLEYAKITYDLTSTIDNWPERGLHIIQNQELGW